MPHRNLPPRIGPFRVTNLLGRGGMGMVYEGIDDATRQVVALKVLNPGLLEDESFRERFQAEIESLRKLKHPHIVELYGFGEDGQQLYYVMERVWGRNLQEELAAGRRFDWREVTRIAIQICGALKHAHDHGVIHRDLKPANLLWTEDEQVKLTDFGIARLFGMARITQGSVLGTADYMAPEQAAGSPVSPRCDLYSLGCVMYALLTGRPPFTGRTVAEVVLKAQRDAPVPPEKLTPDVPAELSRLILQLLAKDPRDRIPTALAVSHRLQSLRRSLTLTPTDDEVSNDTPPAGYAEPLDRESSSAAPPRPLASSPAPAGPRGPVDAEEEERRIREQPTVALELDSRGRPKDPSLDDSGITLRGVDAVRGAPPPTDRHRTAEAPVAGTVPPMSPDSRYTSVVGSERSEEVEPAGALRQSWWTAGLIIGGAALVLALWSLVWRPLSADELFERIARTTESEPVRAWTDVAPLMDEFVNRHAADPRRGQVEQWRQELELDRYARRLELQLRRTDGITRLHPCEQLYLDAVHLAAQDPEAALPRLKALIGLATALLDDEEDANVDGDESSNPPAGEATGGGRDGNGGDGVDDDQRAVIRACRDVAIRKLERLEEQIQQTREAHRAFIQQQLDDADRWASTDRARAEAVWRELIELYNHRAWAADLVEEARRRLD